MAYKYTMEVRIEIGTDEAKKDSVRDALLAKLNEAKAALWIESAFWSVQETPITEAGKI